MEEFKYKEEIISSRVGFLGGSDGNLLSSIAKLENIPEGANVLLYVRVYTLRKMILRRKLWQLVTN